MQRELSTIVRDLNQVILMLAPAHVARPSAPASFANVVRQRGILTVWEGASDRTLYGDARVNHAFRAWHDSHHIAGQFDFTLDGERRACEAQCRELLTLWPRAHVLARVVQAEIIGQAEYFAALGRFPSDQAAFVLTELEKWQN